MKAGDLVRYDNRIGILTEIRSRGKDNVQYIILTSEGFFNLGKYQRSCIEVIG